MERLKDSVRRKKALFIILIILSLICVVLAVISAISLNGGIFNVNLDNVPYINFLRGKIGFATFVFNCIMVVGFTYLVILITFCKPYLSVIGILFYLYFVYSQILIFVSIILIFGFFNVLITIILLLAIILVEIAMLLIILLEVSKFCNCQNYFKSCFNKNDSNLMLYTIALFAFVFIFCIVTVLLKQYVVLLVY